jgi:hypothetical protein
MNFLASLLPLLASVAKVTPDAMRACPDLSTGFLLQVSIVMVGLHSYCLPTLIYYDEHDAALLRFSLHHCSLCLYQLPKCFLAALLQIYAVVVVIFVLSSSTDST